MKKTKFIVQFICWSILIAVILLLLFWNRVDAGENLSDPVTMSRNQADVYINQGNCAVVYREGRFYRAVIWDYDFDDQTYTYVDQVRFGSYAGYTVHLHFTEEIVERGE